MSYRLLSKCIQIALTLVPTVVLANQYYVSPNGSPSGTGATNAPWDLATALAQPAAVQPGDTIWLLGGVYNGPFVSNLNGSASAPIIVRQYPGQRATLEAPITATDVLTVNGSNTWYWGFEVTCPDPDRTDIRTEGVGVYGANVELINLVVHDDGQGFGFWQTATNSTIYGSIIYNNGYELPDRGHGHSIYTQNGTGTKHILDNIFFQSFSEGIQEYGSSNAPLNNYDIEGNIAFDHGMPSAAGAKDNLLIGGGNVAQNQVIVNNYTYYPSWAPGRNDIGYASGCNNATITGNYFAQPVAINLNCTNVTISGNTLDGSINGFSTSQFPSNTFGNPGGVQVFVRPNQYEPGRANIVVFDWSGSPTVNVDVSNVLTVGQSYVVQDVQNFYGPPVASGTYNGGTISLPTTMIAVSATTGLFPVPQAHTAQEFNAYVLLPAGSSSNTPPPAVAPTVSAGSNQTITLPASATLSGSASVNGSVVLADHGSWLVIGRSACNNG